MLRLPYSLLFPTLVHQSEANFKNLPSNAKTRIFTLDWSKIEDEKTRRWENQFDVSPKPVKYCDVLPESLKEWTEKKQFALSENFLEEIRHCSLKAAEEWSRRKPVQTHAIDPAIGPTMAYVDNAFHLLSDCLYDPETNYYSRSGTKLIAPYILSYRFWAYQVPYWSVKMFTDLPELGKLLESLKTEDQETYLAGTQALTLLENHLKELEDNHFWPKKEEVRSEGTFTDFLTNRLREISIPTFTLTLPVLGDITLISPKLKRARGEITLSAEFRCKDTSRTLQILSDYSDVFDFQLNAGKTADTSIMAWGASIVGISSTPPLTINIKINHIGSTEPKTDKEVKKIDLDKVKTAKEQAVQYLDN